MIKRYNVKIDDKIYNVMLSRVADSGGRFTWVWEISCEGILYTSDSSPRYTLALERIEQWLDAEQKDPFAGVQVMTLNEWIDSIQRVIVDPTLPWTWTATPHNTSSTTRP